MMLSALRSKRKQKKHSSPSVSGAQDSRPVLVF